MKTRVALSLTACLLALLVLGGRGLPVGAPQGQPEALAGGPIAAAFLQAPLTFEINRGQTAAQVRYLSRAPGYTLFLTPGEAVLVLQRDQQTSRISPATLAPEGAPRDPRTRQPGMVLRLRLVGANPAPQVEGLEPLPGKANYFLGNDPTKWRTNIPTYSKVKYQAVYPGVDLVYYSTNQRQLEYDFVVAPGADPKAIRLAFTGVDRLSLDAGGNLLLHMAGGEVLQRAPRVYQERNGARQAVSGRYVLRGKDQVGFRVAGYDRTKPLVIDPVLSLSYSTYLGGNGSDQGNGIAVDAAGNAYVTGSTDSGSASSGVPFPTTTGAFQAIFGGGSGTDAFVAKLNPNNSGTLSLLYSTYLGGSLSDSGAGIAVDAAGNAYVTGSAGSLNFPLMNRLTGPTGVNDGTGGDAFVAKLDPTQAGAASLLYSTFLGGNNFDQGLAIAVDKITGDAYVTGLTFSPNFQLVNPLMSSSGVNDGTGGDAFVSKLSFSSGGSTFSVTVSLAGSGTGTVTSSPSGINCPGTCTGTFAIGTTVTLTATPTGGSTLSWGGDCAFAGTGTTCSLTLDANKSVTATFSGGGGGPPGGGGGSCGSPNATLTRHKKKLDDPKVCVELHRKPTDDDFKLDAFFTPGPGSDGIDPLTEEVTLEVGPFHITIPPGSFTMEGKNFKFKSKMKGPAGPDLDVKIQPKDKSVDTFKVEAHGHDVDLTGIANPVDVCFAVGTDTGSAMVMIKHLEKAIAEGHGGGCSH